MRMILDFQSIPIPDAAVIAKAAKCLAAGGLVILPTETVYGIACIPTNPKL